MNVLTLLALIAACAIGPRHAASQPLSVVTVGGRVIAETGSVVAGARVELAPGGRWTTAGADGVWTLDGLAPGDYTVRITADGFDGTAVAAVFGQRGDSIDVVLRRRPYRMHESVTVTARREAAQSYDVPRTVTVIGSRELDEQMPRSTPDALWEASGVFVQKTNLGGGSPFIRGLIGNQILIMVDGIRLNNSTFRYGPNQYLATIDPALIEQIEVVRGSGSVLYGSDAIGGVVNIVTRRPHGVGQPTAVTGRLDTKFMTSGMEQSGRLEAAITGPRGGLQAGLSLRRFGDLHAGAGLGVESPSGYDGFAGDVRAELPLSASRRVTFVYQHDAQHDVPRYDQVAQRGFERYAFDPQVRQMAYARYEQSLAGVWASSLRATASLQRTVEQREYRSRGADVLTVERDRVMVGGLSMELRSGPHPSVALVSGIDYYTDRVNSWRHDVSDVGGQGSPTRGLYPDGATSDSTAFFTHATLTRPRWLIDGGVRVGRIAVAAPDPVFGSAEIAPSMATASGSAMFTLVEGVRLFGSVAQGFRAPNVDDLASLGRFDFGVEVPSPNLEPETSVAIEAGVKLRLSRGGGSLAVYRTTLDRLIERVPGTFEGSPWRDGQAVFHKANVGSAFVRGVEADGEFMLAPPVSLRGSLTYTYGQATSRDEPFRRIPPLHGQVVLRVTPRPALWMEGALRVARRQDRLASGDLADYRIPAGGTPGWRVANLRAGVRLSGRMQLVGEMQNLFDEAYRTHGSGIDGVGRSAWIGLHVR